MQIIIGKKELCLIFISHTEALCSHHYVLIFVQIDSFRFCFQLKKSQNWTCIHKKMFRPIFTKTRATFGNGRGISKLEDSLVPLEPGLSSMWIFVRRNYDIPCLASVAESSHSQYTASHGSPFFAILSIYLINQMAQNRLVIFSLLKKMNGSDRDLGACKSIK